MTRLVMTVKHCAVHAVRISRVFFGLTLQLWVSAALLARAASAAAAHPRLLLDPASVTLDGPLARQQLIATAHDASGGVHDVTVLAQFSVLTPGVAQVDSSGVLLPYGDGSTIVVVRYREQQAELPVEVRG